jgi:hypothetical protein
MILDRLKEKPENKILKPITLIAFIIFISLTIIFSLMTSGMVIFKDYGVLDFEFAWTAEQINVIFAAWGTEGMQIQALAVYLDFLYIIGYSLFIFGLLLMIARRLEGKIQDITIIVGLTALIAGVFDVIENINLLLMLGDPGNVVTLNASTASFCAIIKFSLLIIEIIWFLITLVVLLIQRNK